LILIFAIFSIFFKTCFFTEYSSRSKHTTSYPTAEITLWVKLENTVIYLVPYSVSESFRHWISTSYYDVVLQCLHNVTVAFPYCLLNHCLNGLRTTIFIWQWIDISGIVKHHFHWFINHLSINRYQAAVR